MLSGVLDVRVPHPAHRHATPTARRLAPGLAGAPVFAPAVAQRQRRQQRLELALVAHHDDLLVVHRVLREHAQVQHGTRATGVFDDHVGAVQHVGRAAFVAFVEVVHALRARGEHARGALAQDQVHQVEVVAALLHQGAAGVVREAVPVADLGVERLSVLANRNLVQRAHRARMGHADHLGHRRHVAVFLSDPHQRLAAFGELHQLDAVFDADDQWLLDQDVRIGLQRVAHHFDVREVGRRDHDCIAQPAGQQVVVVVEHARRLRGVLQQRQRGVAAGSVRVGDGRDLCALERPDVFYVLAAHAAAANEPISNFLNFLNFLHHHVNPSNRLA